MISEPWELSGGDSIVFDVEREVFESAAFPDDELVLEPVAPSTVGGKVVRRLRVATRHEGITLSSVAMGEPVSANAVAYLDDGSEQGLTVVLCRTNPWRQESWRRSHGALPQPRGDGRGVRIESKRAWAAVLYALTFVLLVATGLMRRGGVVRLVTVVAAGGAFLLGTRLDRRRHRAGPDQETE